MGDSIYVLSQNGMHYRNPVLMFREGLIHFPGLIETAEILLWEPCEISPRLVLDQVLGADGWDALLKAHRLNEEIEIPGPDQPPRRARVRGYYFNCKAPIPAPLYSDGFEKYASRLKGEAVLRFGR